MLSYGGAALPCASLISHMGMTMIGTLGHCDRSGWIESAKPECLGAKAAVERGV